MATSRRNIAAALAGLLAFGALAAAPAQAATQRVSYFMNGDCQDYYEMNDEYAFFEEEAGWNCFITVKVAPVKPQRTIKLQYWNDRKWVTESSARTSSKGVGRLDFDELCDDDLYCDGTWGYRVLVDAAPGQRYQTSQTFDVTYYPISSDEDTDYLADEDGYAQ